MAATRLQTPKVGIVVAVGVKMPVATRGEVVVIRCLCPGEVARRNHADVNRMPLP
jgi:hypothetical protein